MSDSVLTEPVGILGTQTRLQLTERPLNIPPKMCLFDRVKKSGLNTAENHDAAEESFEADVPYAAEDGYAAQNAAYAPEDTEYSEENQFT